MPNIYPTKNYGDVVLQLGNQTTRLEKAFMPGGDFITKEQGALLTQGVVRQMGLQLFSNLQKEFSVHNITGETLRTMEIQIKHMSVVIRMSGGGPFVEGGFAAHDVLVHDPASSLHWVDFSDAFAKEVHNPGYIGDPFVERSMDDLNFDNAFENVTRQVFSDTMPQLSNIAESVGGNIHWQDDLESAP
jgi:hypothetical protein